MILRLMFAAALLTLCGTLLPVPAAAAGDSSRAAEVRRDVERTLDLWRDGRYEEMYQRITTSGGQTREYFVSHLAAAPRRPSCCWEKLQEVRVTVKETGRATLQGRFGFDSGAGTEFMTRGVTLEHDDGIWKMKMSDVLSLAGKGKKVRGGKKRPD